MLATNANLDRFVERFQSTWIQEGYMPVLPTYALTRPQCQGLEWQRALPLATRLCLLARERYSQRSTAVTWRAPSRSATSACSPDARRSCKYRTCGICADISVVINKAAWRPADVDGMHARYHKHITPPCLELLAAVQLSAQGASTLSKGSAGCAPAPAPISSTRTSLSCASMLRTAAVMAAVHGACGRAVAISTQPCHVTHAQRPGVACASRG